MANAKTSQAKHQQFEKWVKEVRDPAVRSNEGTREIATESRGAVVEYRIGVLPDERWAMASYLTYTCGDSHGSAMPWEPFESREKCVEVFLSRARRMFSEELVGGCTSDSQVSAQKEMLGLLAGDGLFGFVEPEPL